MLATKENTQKSESRQLEKTWQQAYFYKMFIFSWSINVLQIQTIIWKNFYENKAMLTLRKQSNCCISVKPPGKLTDFVIRSIIKQSISCYCSIFLVPVYTCYQFYCRLVRYNCVGALLLVYNCVVACSIVYLV